MDAFILLQTHECLVVLLCDGSIEARAGLGAVGGRNGLAAGGLNDDCIFRNSPIALDAYPVDRALIEVG